MSLQYFIGMTGLHTGLFYGRGTHISGASRGSSGKLPQKILR